MRRLYYLFLLVVWCCSFTFTVNADSCQDFVKTRVSLYGSTIKSGVNQFRNLSATFISKNRTLVTFKCESDSLLVGPSQVICHGNGTWSEKIPECIEQCPNALAYFSKNLKVSSTNRTVNTTLYVECSLPKYTFSGEHNIKCIHGQKWTTLKGLELEKGVPNFPKCKLKPAFIGWINVLIISGSVAGVVLFLIIFLSVCIWTRMKYGKHIDDELKRNPDVLQDMFCTKVWNVDRNKKLAIVANDFQSLKNSACLLFSTNGRLVLEEDGTPVNNDETLSKNKDKTLMILGKNDKWRNPRWRKYNDSKQSGAFQVFSSDRKKSVWILCYSLEDLCEQALHMLGYLPKNICFNDDGTPINIDRELFSFIGSRLIALKEGQRWTNPRDNTSTLYQVSGRHVFNVWTEDGRRRKEVYAENIVDLHLMAARSLGLQPPIDLRTLNGQQIDGNAPLESYVHDVLIATEVRNQGYGLHLSRDTLSVYSA